MGEALAVTGSHDLPEGGSGDVQGLGAAALHQSSGVYDHPARPHGRGNLTGPGDIADGLLQGLWVRVGQIDEVGGVEGQGYPAGGGVLPDLTGGVHAHVNALAALVFVAVQAEVRDPLRRGQGGFMGLGKAVGVSGGTKFRAHRKGLLFPSSRKGVSTAYRM